MLAELEIETETVVSSWPRSWTNCRRAKYSAGAEYSRFTVEIQPKWYVWDVEKTMVQKVRTAAQNG